MIRSINLEIEVTEDSRLDEIFSLLEKIPENIETNWSVRITRKKDFLTFKNSLK